MNNIYENNFFFVVISLKVNEWQSDTLLKISLYFISNASELSLHRHFLLTVIAYNLVHFLFRTKSSLPEGFFDDIKKDAKVTSWFTTFSYPPVLFFLFFLYVCICVEFLTFLHPKFLSKVRQVPVVDKTEQEWQSFQQEITKTEEV